MRDSQRQRVYDAEDVLNGPTMSLSECQQFVDEVLHSQWWRTRSDLRRITVLDGRRRRSACAGHDWIQGNVIRLPRATRIRYIVLHEMAHHLTRSGAPHGPEFASNMVGLVRRFMGDGDYLKLKASFRRHRVRARGATKARGLRKAPCRQCGRICVTDRMYRLRHHHERFCKKSCLEIWWKNRLSQIMVKPG